ncbi:MAG TPA: oxidoreductase [Gammaproteobacteria bacterium]|nr:oxidoreductase [Gammaproteobacteria bacterium]
MKKLLNWLLKGLLAIVLLLALGGVSLWAFLPDRYVVNTPLRGLFQTQPLDSQTLHQRLKLPPGFSLSLYATGIDGIRVIRATAAGDLVASAPRTGQVWLLREDQHGGIDSIELVAGLNRPHGIELHHGWLYIAETDAVGRIRFDPVSGQVSGEYQHIVDGLPAGGMHWTRTLRLGPDGWMYLTVGSNCNACEDEPLRAAMHRFKPDGSSFETFASGLRNAVGFAWAPWSGELFVTDNGRDLLGDDLPPCELNRVTRNGFYGWPYAWGDRQPDPDLGEANSQRVAQSVPPAHGFAAHTAPLGIEFLTGASLPEGYQRSALVAQHGSWNRTRKAGYQVVSLHWDDQGKVTERPFLTGFEVDEAVYGRPAFITQASDGTIYLSDDYTGSVYRIRFGDLGDQPVMDFSKRVVNTSVEDESAGKADPLGDYAAGQALYQQYDCASCHDPARAGEGQVIVKLESLQSRYSPASLSSFLQTPTPPMPAFPLSVVERRQLAAYLLTR